MTASHINTDLQFIYCYIAFGAFFQRVWKAFNYQANIFLMHICTCTCMSQKHPKYENCILISAVFEHKKYIYIWCYNVSQYNLNSYSTKNWNKHLKTIRLRFVCKHYSVLKCSTFVMCVVHSSLYMQNYTMHNIMPSMLAHTPLTYTTNSLFCQSYLDLLPNLNFAQLHDIIHVLYSVMLGLCQV